MDDSELEKELNKEEELATERGMQRKAKEEHRKQRMREKKERHEAKRRQRELYEQQQLQLVGMKRPRDVMSEDEQHEASGEASLKRFKNEVMVARQAAM